VAGKLRVVVCGWFGGGCVMLVSETLTLTEADVICHDRCNYADARRLFSVGFLEHYVGQCSILVRRVQT
jgi:hypothetical protein